MDTLLPVLYTLAAVVGLKLVVIFVAGGMSFARVGVASRAFFKVLGSPEVAAKVEPLLAAAKPEPAKADKLGLSVRPLGADERKSASTQGYLLVEDVDGPAAQAGVRPGDVILGVNGKPVKSMAEFRNATSTASKTVAILLERDGGQLFLPIRIS